MRVRAKGHHREGIDDEILSEFRYMPVEARHNVEEHGTRFSRPDLTRGFGMFHNYRICILTVVTLRVGAALFIRS